MKQYIYFGLIAMVLIGTTGCSQIQGTKVFNFFHYKDVLDFSTNCSMNYNISLNSSYCNGTMKLPIFYNYNDSVWNSMCCTFDSRCLAKTNSNVSNICENLNANFTYIGPAYSQNGGPGSMCCAGSGQCFVDHIPLSNCTTINNNTGQVASIAFNLSGTAQWDAMCCISGGY